MRVQHIKISRWRHFEDIEIMIPEDAPVICIVGGNGTGKSQLLELIAACAHQIKLSPGSEVTRGNPFAEEATFEVTFGLGTGIIEQLDDVASFHGDLAEQFSQWDRTLRVSKDGHQGVILTAGMRGNDGSQDFANHVISIVQNSRSIHYMSLDADRAYPKIEVHAHQVGEAFERDWLETNKQSSFRLTRNLYEEWFRYLMGRENQENDAHIQSIRRARERGQAEPPFVDQFRSYKDAVRQVLPHLLFVGVNSQKREIKFDASGLSLSFDQLSGGEREIAFLIGQVERFALKKGLLLVDEPELHLNYDLLRSWIGFLKNSVEQGQIWLATHSLEVVEVAGRDATFVLTRNAESRKVDEARPLSQQPVVSTLSRAVGSPAFSISGLAFVLIEGEEEIGERERFRLLCEVPEHIRFLEAGSCKEVLRRMDGLTSLASASEQVLRIGGIVDGDWRTAQERSDLQHNGVFVLPVHEVENYFLHPETLTELVQSLGGNPGIVAELVREASDKRAGSWIFNAARTAKQFLDFPQPSKDLRELVHRLQFADFADAEQQCAAIATAHAGLTLQQQDLLKQHLAARTTSFKRKRETGEIWKVCEGKEVFGLIIAGLGFASRDAAERALTAIWARRPELVPAELSALRTYIRDL